MYTVYCLKKVFDTSITLILTVSVLYEYVLSANASTAIHLTGRFSLSPRQTQSFGNKSRLSATSVTLTFKFSFTLKTRRHKLVEFPSPLDSITVKYGHFYARLFFVFSYFRQITTIQLTGISVLLIFYAIVPRNAKLYFRKTFAKDENAKIILKKNLLQLSGQFQAQISSTSICRTQIFFEQKILYQCETTMQHRDSVPLSPARRRRQGAFFQFFYAII